MRTTNWANKMTQQHSNQIESKCSNKNVGNKNRIINSGDDFDSKMPQQLNTDSSCYTRMLQKAIDWDEARVRGASHVCILLLLCLFFWVNLCDYNGTPKIFGNISLSLLLVLLLFHADICSGNAFNAMLRRFITNRRAA